MTPEEERQTMQMLETLQRANDPRAVALQQSFQRGMEQVTGQDRLRIDPDVVRAEESAPGRLYGGRVQAPKDTRNPFVQGLSRFTRRAMDALADPVANAQIVAALNSMRMRPDAQLVQAAQGRAQAVQARRQSAQQANMTAQYFRQKGQPELAAIIEEVPSVASAALEALFKEPRAMSTFEQKLAAVKAANPKMPYSEVVNKVLSGDQPTTILKQMGTVPPGYKAEYDAEGNVTSLTPIPGGPAAQKSAETEKKNERVFAVYEQAVAGMQKALGAAPTGYFAGMLPAITVGMQQLDAATQSFLPTLKDVFRGAGEGTFTEGDQEILTNLVPTRQDAPQVAAFKLEQLDRMVRIKLGQDPAPSSLDIDAEPPPAPEGSGLSQQEWRDRWANMTEQERNQFRRQE